MFTIKQQETLLHLLEQLEEIRQVIAQRNKNKNKNRKNNSDTEIKYEEKINNQEKHGDSISIFIKENRDIERYLITWLKVRRLCQKWIKDKSTPKDKKQMAERLLFKFKKEITPEITNFNKKLKKLSMKDLLNYFWKELEWYNSRAENFLTIVPIKSYEIYEDLNYFIDLIQYVIQKSIYSKSKSYIKKKIHLLKQHFEIEGGKKDFAEEEQKAEQILNLNNKVPSNNISLPIINQQNDDKIILQRNTTINKQVKHQSSLQTNNIDNDNELIISKNNLDSSYNEEIIIDEDNLMMDSWTLPDEEVFREEYPANTSSENLTALMIKTPQNNSSQIQHSLSSNTLSTLYEQQQIYPEPQRAEPQGAEPQRAEPQKKELLQIQNVYSYYYWYPGQNQNFFLVLRYCNQCGQPKDPQSNKCSRCNYSL